MVANFHYAGIKSNDSSLDNLLVAVLYGGKAIKNNT